MPTREQDNLESKEFITIQDLLSEGEIEGFASPSKRGIARTDSNYNNACLADIFLNDVPIITPSAVSGDFVSRVSNLAASDFNFDGVSFQPRFGTSDQSPVVNIANNALVMATNTVDGPSPVVEEGVTGQYTTPSISQDKHAIQITIQFSQLQKFEENGDIVGTSVRFRIQRQINHGLFEDILDETITGRSKDPYSIEYQFRLPITATGEGDYSQARLRVIRMTEDSPDPTILQNEFRVSRVEEVVFDVKRYPNCAYSTLRLGAEQFPNIPKRAFRIRGMKIAIPGSGAANTGTPTVDPLTGRIIYPENYIFNGNMQTQKAWCTCPALILLDLLTNKRYGLGVHIAPNDSNPYENIDLFSYIQASKYANEEVVLQNGSTEARYSCNVALQGSKEAFTLINELSGVMRAFPIWQTGSVTITQDKPTDPSYLFSLANVGETGFTYQGSSLKQRHSIVAVSYFNMESREIDYEVVEDPVAIQKYGTIKKTIKAFGTTSRSQAIRLAKAVLFSEQQESETVSFTTSIDAGVLVRPGNVIAISDPVRSVERRSGRVKSATTSAITVDNSQNLNTFLGSNKTLSVILPGGKQQTIPVNSISGDVINLVNNLDEVPLNNSIWMLSSSGSTGVEPQTFRVISVEEQEDVNYAITALTYVPGKYANIEQGVTLPDRSLSLLNNLRNPPTGLSAEERTYQEGSVTRVKVILSWIPVTGVRRYQVHYRFNDANWTIVDAYRPDFEILNSGIGTYDFKVYSYNASLQLSRQFSTARIITEGRIGAPSDIQGLTLEPVSEDLVRLRWALSQDADVLNGGQVYVRHSNVPIAGTGAFANAIDLIEALPGNSTEALVPALSGEYILKFRDTTGTFSRGESSVLFTLPDLIDAVQVLTDREDTDNPAFSGVKNNTIVKSDALEIDDLDVSLTGTYDFAEVLDCGAVFSLNLSRVMQTSSFYAIGNTIEDLIPEDRLWDDYATDGNFDGPAIETTHASMEVSTTDDDPSDPNATFTDFSTFTNGTYKARGFKFKAILETETSGFNIRFIQLGVNGKFLSRTERNYKENGDGAATSDPISSGDEATGLDVIFANPFFPGTAQMGGLNALKPSVGITIMNASGGEYFVIKLDEHGNYLNANNQIITGKGFNITIKNANNVPINKVFTFQAVGYGKGV